MKVYFDATPSQLDKYRQNYQNIGRAIKKLGHELTSRWILDFDPSFFDLPRNKWKDHYLAITRSLEQADVAILDISVSSTSIGQLIQYAFMRGKPVIALRDHQAYKNIFLEGAGEAESKIVVVEYNLENVERKLKEAFEYIEEWLYTRFTFLIDGETKRLLDKVAASGVSRSEYIRGLIKANSIKGRA